MNIEKLLAYHCGPALAGIKPANLVSIKKSHCPDLYIHLDGLNGKLNSRGLFFEILCECDSCALILVYRYEKLCEYLCGEEIKEFLTDCGYPPEFSLHEYLKILKRRIFLQRRCGMEFPHEIGAFLGYPVCDIYGFMEHRGKDCILTGDWKVYGDAEKAKKCFDRFHICRNAILKRVNNGISLSELFSPKARIG